MRRLLRGGKRAVGLIAILSLASLALSSTGRADEPDLSWPPNNIQPGSVGFVIEDSWIVNSQISVPIPNSPACSSLTDPQCAALGEKHGWWMTRVAPPCALALPWEECVESLALVGEGSTTRLTYTGQAPGITFASDPRRGLPTGSTMSLFDDPESDSPEDGYAAYLGGQMIGRKGPFHLGELSLQVFRYRLVPYTQSKISGGCLWYSTTHCAERRAFPAGTAIKATVRLHTSVTGWLGGRLEDPSIRVTPVPGVDLNRVEISAKPIDVPLVAVAIAESEITPAIRDHWEEICSRSGGQPCPMHVPVLESWSPGLLGYLRAYEPFLRDTATRVIPTWSVVPLLNAMENPCLDSTTRLLGLVTTNATIYNARPPAFSGNSLKYKVAALHYLPGGEVFRGTYDLVMRSETARCLYGFTNAPIRADIEVVSEDGTEQVVTTSIAESDGWLRLSARNFSFSRPTITVTLKSQSRERVIICEKGEKTKKVTGVKPTCPKGWRRAG